MRTNARQTIREHMRFLLLAAQVAPVRLRLSGAIDLLRTAYKEDVKDASPAIIPHCLEDTLVEYLVETDPGPDLQRPLFPDMM